MDVSKFILLHKRKNNVQKSKKRTILSAHVSRATIEARHGTGNGQGNESKTNKRRAETQRQVAAREGTDGVFQVGSLECQNNVVEIEIEKGPGTCRRTRFGKRANVM